MRTERRDELTYVVIGKAMEAHRNLGPGLDEIFYHELLSSKLKVAGIEHERKPRGRIIHRGIVADHFEADIVVPRQLVAELKVLWEDFAPDHVTQIFCYQKFWRIDTGLLLDVG